jgi:uncharacterized protein (TIGR02996 family)
MPDEDAFLRAVIDNPEDDLPRLVYADWLDEHGDPERAEFVRVQCAMARPPMSKADFERWFSRSQELLSVHRERWLGPLAEFVEWSWFRRGFVYTITLNAAALLARAEAIWRTAPIQRVVLKNAWEVTDRLATCVHLGRLTGLSLDNNRLAADEVDTLLTSPYLARLQTLDLGGNLFGTETVVRLSNTPALSGLRELDLSHNDVGARGVTALHQSPYLQGLARLKLNGAAIGARGVAALANGNGLPHLLDVELGFTELGSRGVRALLHGRCASRWKQLFLVGVELEDAEKAALIDSFGADAVHFG